MNSKTTYEKNEGKHALHYIINIIILGLGKPQKKKLQWGGLGDKILHFKKFCLKCI